MKRAILLIVSVNTRFIEFNNISPAHGQAQSGHTPRTVISTSDSR